MSTYSFPDQTIAENKKDEQWHKDHIINYVSYSDSDSDPVKKEMLKYFRAYQGELNEEEQELTKSITCPGGIDLGQEYIVYPLIQSKIEQMVGEFSLRPIRRKSYVIDKKNQSKKLQEKVKMASEEIMREITKELEGSLGFKPQTENPEMELPKDIEEFFEKDHKMICEEVSDSLLRLFLDVNKQKAKFKDLFTQYSIVDRAHAVLDKIDGHTNLRSVHALDADTDIDPYKVVQDDHEFFFENYYLTQNEIFNSFQLNNTQKDEIKALFKQMEDGFDPDNDSNYRDELEISTNNKGWFRTSNKTHRLRVVWLRWKSRQRTSIKISKNKEGKVFHKKLNPDYKERKKDVIKHIDKEMPRFCIMIGPDLCLDYGLEKDRYSRIDSPWHCYLPIVSIIRDNTVGSSKIKSVAAKLYQLQQMASEILFELRLAYKSAGDSRALVYDASQMPKSFASQGGIKRVVHHLKKDKLLIINSKDKQGKNSFNQFTSLDLSQKGAVNDLIAGLAFIDDLASKFVGISPEREGNVGQYQTATGTDKAIRGSAARTEIIYTPFDDFIQTVLERAIMKMQKDYHESQVIQYVFGEMKTKFITIFKEFFSADLGVYLADGRKDKEASERIERAAELAIQSTNSPEMMEGLIEIFEGESASEKKATFRRILNEIAEIREANQKAAQEQFAAEQEAKARKDEGDAQLTREGHQKDIQVAQIYKESEAEKTLQNNLTKERVEAAKIGAQNEKNRKEN